MQYTDQQLLMHAEKASGFKGWVPGMYGIAVRSNADVPDAFDDKFYLFEVVFGVPPKFLMAATCTTHPGLDVLKNFPTKYNQKGALVYATNQICYDSHLYGLHKGYPAYVQRKPMHFFRDTDRDNKAEEIGKTELAVNAANIHRANPKKKSVINHNWSAGCVVMNDPTQFAGFMAMMNKRPLNLCVLKEF